MAEHSIEEIREWLQSYVNDKDLCPQKAVKLYCILNDKWGYARFNESGESKYTAVIEDRD